MGQDCDDELKQNDPDQADTLGCSLPYSFVQKFKVCVGEQNEEGVVVYYQDPLHPNAYSECRRHLAGKISWLLLSESDFQKHVTKIYDESSEDALAALSQAEGDFDLDDMMSQLPKVQDLLQSDDDAPIIRLINAVLTKAIGLQASDIHFETFEEDLKDAF